MSYEGDTIEQPTIEQNISDTDSSQKQRRLSERRRKSFEYIRTEIYPRIEQEIIKKWRPIYKKEHPEIELELKNEDEETKNEKIDQYIKTDMKAYITKMAFWVMDIEKEAKKDKMTNMYDSEIFEDRLKIEEELLKARGHEDETMLVINIDLNNFKRINDVYGHEKGNDAIKLFADQLQSFSDDQIGFPARLGGDEFGFIINHVKEDQLEKTIKSIKQHFSNLKLFIDNNNSLSINASIGVTTINKNNTKNVKDVIKEADFSSYVAKTYSKEGETVIYKFGDDIDIKMITPEWRLEKARKKIIRNSSIPYGELTEQDFKDIEEMAKIEAKMMERHEDPNKP